MTHGLTVGGCGGSPPSNEINSKYRSCGQGYQLVYLRSDILARVGRKSTGDAATGRVPSEVSDLTPRRYICRTPTGEAAPKTDSQRSIIAALGPKLYAEPDDATAQQSAGSVLGIESFGSQLSAFVMSLRARSTWLALDGSANQAQHIECSATS